MRGAQYFPHAACLIVALIITCVHSSLKEEKKKTSIDSLPEEIMANIFFKVAFYDIRNILTRVSKNWRNVVYKFPPDKLKLNYDSAKSDNNYLMIPDKNFIMIPNRAIAYNRMKSLEISAKNDFNKYADLLSFAEQDLVRFENLEYLKVKMEWTSSNDNAAYVLAELVKKAGKLKTFELEWTDDTSEGFENNVESKNNNFKYFWEMLSSSRVRNVKFKIYDTPSYKQGPSFFDKNIRYDFYRYIFNRNKFAVLKNLRKLTLKVPPSGKIWDFLWPTLKESENSLEELNVDLNYIVEEWMRDDFLSQISRCKNLKKFKLNFPMVNVDYYKFIDDDARFSYTKAWNDILNLLTNMGNDIFFELKTTMKFISQERHLWIYDRDYVAESWNNTMIKGLSLRDNFNQADRFSNSMAYAREVEKLINQNPNLEKFKIVNKFYDATLYTVQQFLLVASKIPKLKELTIYYRQSHATFKEIYKILKYYLLHNFDKINKLTIRVTSSRYVVHCVEIEKAYRNYAKVKEKYLNENYIEHVGGNNVLNDSVIQEIKDCLPLFNVQFIQLSRHHKHDSQVLIFDRK